MRQFQACGMGIRLQEPYRRHQEPRHAERALDSLFVNHPLLYRVQLAVPTGQAFNRNHFPVADGMGLERARVVRDVIDQDSARSALRAVAYPFRARAPESVAKRPAERLLL